MFKTEFCLLKITLVSLFVNCIAVSPGANAQSHGNTHLDVRKGRIESNVKSLLKTPDISKLLTGRGSSKRSGSNLKIKESNLKVVRKNSKQGVRPGIVNWHSSFAKAQTASKLSKKPMLVFHMMGNLDDRFC